MMKVLVKKRLLLPIILLILLLVFPLLFKNNPSVIRIGVTSLLYGILAVSLNFISGVAGQVSMGHAAFFAIGAYTSTMLMMDLNMPYLICLLAAIIVAGIGGLIIGIPSLRLTGGYLAIISLGFSEIVRMLLLNLKDVFGGGKGLMSIPRPVIFGVKISSVPQFYYLFLFFLVLSYIVLYDLINSRFGRNLRALKSDDMAAESVGINVYKHKVIAFVISAAVAGIAGSLYAHYMTFISPSSFSPDVSTTILSMVVLGGLGSMTGAVIAPIILTALPEMLRSSLTNYRMLVYGVLLIAIMLSKTAQWSESGIGVWLAQKISNLKSKGIKTTSNEEGVK